VDRQHHERRIEGTSALSNYAWELSDLVYMQNDVDMIPRLSLQQPPSQPPRIQNQGQGDQSVTC
jgi:hypothetical protein